MSAPRKTVVYGQLVIINFFCAIVYKSGLCPYYTNRKLKISSKIAYTYTAIKEY